MFWIVGGAGILRALEKFTGSPILGGIRMQLTHVDWEGFRFYDTISKVQKVRLDYANYAFRIFGPRSPVIEDSEARYTNAAGVTATSEQAQEAHAFVRSLIADLYGPDAAAKIRIQYGGSVKPNNAAELMACPDIDGALIGGAALDPQSFLDIIRNGTAAE
jgi:hypothetical protein